jgi:hypothetical protein
MNNDLLYDAAYNGAVAGAYAGKPPTSTYEPTDVEAGAQALATAVDAQIPFDNTITVSSTNPAALAATTSAITQAQAAKSRLVFALVSGAQMGKAPLLSVNGEDVSYVAFAEGIAEAYTTLVADLV